MHEPKFTVGVCYPSEKGSLFAAMMGEPNSRKGLVAGNNSGTGEKALSKLVARAMTRQMVAERGKL